MPLPDESIPKSRKGFYFHVFETESHILEWPWLPNLDLELLSSYLHLKMLRLLVSHHIWLWLLFVRQFFTKCFRLVWNSRSSCLGCLSSGITGMSQYMWLYFQLLSCLCYWVNDDRWNFGNCSIRYNMWNPKTLNSNSRHPHQKARHRLVCLNPSFGEWLQADPRSFLASHPSPEGEA